MIKKKDRKLLKDENKYSREWKRIVECPELDYPMMKCQGEWELNIGCTVLFLKGFKVSCIRVQIVND